MNIGIFTDTYFPQVSGVSTSIQLLRDELTRQGHEVTLFTTTDPKAKTKEDGVIRFESIPFIFFHDRRVAMPGLLRALVIAKEKKLDVIHTQTEFGMGFLGLQVATILNLPVVHTYHTWYEHYVHYIAKGKILTKSHVKTLSKLFCNQINHIISPSETMNQVLSDYGVTRPISIVPTGVVIPEPMNPEKLIGLRHVLGMDDDFVLLSVNRLSQEKNLDLLIQEMPTILKTTPNAKLLLVGDGPQREELEQLTASLNLTDKVIFYGFCSHDLINEFYQMADLYVNLSTTETQGLTFLEAISNRLPVLAIRNDYLSGLITDASTGTLLDNVNQLSDKFTTYYDYLKTDARSEKTKAFDQLLKRISVETFANNVLQVYREIEGSDYQGLHWFYYLKTSFPLMTLFQDREDK